IGDGQAARTVARNLPTSVLGRLLSSDRDFAAVSTCADAVPVFSAPALTSEMLPATFAVPAAACCTLRVISLVAAACSSTADAMVVAISEIRPMVPPISLMATTESRVAACISAIWLLLSLGGLGGWIDRA